ncbi:Broad-Complex, Tramtrack and Bric a brac [Branchiostoma belcheri]|nr:Broad-Complex, Tramtrack and Bric a brac [Branchiostoma belcheri]
MAAADQDGALRPRSFQDESYLHGFLGTVGDLQKEGELQDVVLEVEGRRFPCHRLVLSAASPYFRAMFTSDMAESRQETVVLQLDYVRDTCSSYMARNVELSTYVDLYKFADVFSVGVVLKRCLRYICRHFVKVSSSEEFCSLSVDQLTEIISHDELDVTEETRVWEAVVRWVQHSTEDSTSEILCMNPREGKYTKVKINLPPHLEDKLVVGMTVTSDNDLYILIDELDDHQLSVRVQPGVEGVGEYWCVSSTQVHCTGLGNGRILC